MQDTGAPTDYLVVVGASAGGIEALIEMVSGLPADFQAPMVITQHLDPRRPSHLAEILAQRGRLAVRVVEGREPLRPGVIYLVPADRQVEIADHEVRLCDPSGSGPRPSVDVLFRGAAGAYGEQLIAVVLTGSDADAAAGAAVVKAAGGMVIIQNTSAARYPTMPASLAPAVVDVVADLERIGPLLYDLVRGAYLPSQPGDEVSLRDFLEGMRLQSGLDFTSYPMPAIRRRLQRRMAAVQTGQLTEYVRYVADDPEEYQRLINSFLIQLTEFFHDPELYAYLREQVLPELIAGAERRGRDLRLWWAGCATGQEAYSLAILVVDALGDQLDRWTVRIFATDLDEGAIEVARRGTYSRAALEHLPAEIVERHFTEVDGAYEVKKSIRGLMVFGQHDLGQRAPFPRIDLCICRNVLAYFTVELQTRALQLFAFSLRDGGYLVLGRSESAGPLAEFFHPVQPQLRVYQRRGERMLIPSARLATAAPFTRRAAKSRRVPAGPVAHSSRDDLARCLLALPIGVIVVDRRYDIQMMNGAASRLLGLHDVAIGQDLIHLARDLPAGQLRALIDAAFEEDASDSAVIPIAGARPAGAVLETMTAGRRAYLRIECYPHVSERSEGDDRTQRTADTVLLVVTDITGQETERRTRDEEATRRQADLAQAIAQLELQAEATRALIGNNQRLTMINIELSTAAEEAAIGTDEAQAATEELETLNEELHATNEELETLNEELQATNEELRTTNEELQARSIELQAQAAMLDEQRQVSEEERARLTAILSSMDDAVLVVDPGGRMILTNPSYDRIFGLGPPTGLEDAGGQPLPPGETPQARVARGDVFSMHFTTTAENGVRRRFEAHGAPVRRDGAVRWGVVVIRDISERSLHELREEFLSSVSHELQTPLTAIRAGLGLLELGAGPVLGPAERELLEAMRRNVERLRLLVDDLLAARQSSVGAPAADHASLDMRAAVTMATAAVQPLLAEKRQPLELELPVPLPVTGDARQLEQVMVNLLANAYRHTPPGTRITVSGWVTADEVRLAVRDTGPGLPAGELEAIFVRFYRAGLASDGAGLGLAIARNVVTLHEGRLWAESREGEGATFHLALPRAGGAEGDTP